MIIFFLFAAPVAAVLLLPYSVMAAIGVLFLSHMLVLYPTLMPNNQWLGKVVTSFRTTSNEIWITIDDGPDPHDTPRILDLLDRFQAKATFFVKGAAARGYPELIAEIGRRGHSVGNHSDTHPAGSFWALGPRRLAREIDGCNEALGNTGVRTNLFRAPVGMKNPFVHPLLARRSMILTGWTARGFDGVPNRSSSEVVRRIAQRLRPGAIVLLHEGVVAADGSRFSLECVEHALETIHARGYRMVIPAIDQLESGRSNASR